MRRRKIAMPRTLEPIKRHRHNTVLCLSMIFWFVQPDHPMVPMSRHG